MNPLDRLREQRDVMCVDADGAAAFAKGGAPGLLLLPGDPTRPEVVDLAVVVTELRHLHPTLRVAVADVGHEAALRERLAVTSFPSLLFVRRDGVAKVLARMQSWATYEQAIASLGGSA